MPTATKKSGSRSARPTKRAAGARAATKAAPRTAKAAKARTAAKAAARSAAGATTKPAAKETADLELGKRAPAFSLTSGNGRKVSLKDFLGKRHVVLYFYPKDMTSGCTKEACAFRDRKREIERLGASVLGVSPDSAELHAKFAGKYDLNFPLLADPGAAVAQKYGVWKEKSLYGRKYMGIERSTFIIGKDGKFKRVWRKVKVAGHDDEVVAALAELAAG